jgi:hypothetical protein
MGDLLADLPRAGCQFLRDKAPRVGLALCGLAAAAAAASNRQPVIIELVLALDASASVDDREFDLERRGLALAFQDPEVLHQIELLQPLGAAIAVIEFGGPGETRVMIPFTRIADARDARAFGFRIGLIHRWMYASSTSITDAIADGSRLIETSDMEGARKIIDVSGDGSDNAGGDLDAAREVARAADITVNGLPIMADDASLADYYRDHVIVGASAFVEPAGDFDDYAHAIREKLLRELHPFDS